MRSLCYRECVHCSIHFFLFINFNITFYTEYCEGLIFIPPLAPPKGTSTTAHLKVMRVANACTSSMSTSSLYLIPTKWEHTVLHCIWQRQFNHKQVVTLSQGQEIL